MPFDSSRLQQAIKDLKTYPSEFARMLRKDGLRQHEYTAQHVNNWLRGTSPNDDSMDDIVAVTGKPRDFFYPLELQNK